MYTNEELELKVQQFLRLVTQDKHLSKLYSFKVDVNSKIDSSLLIELVTRPYILSYDENDGKLYYIDNEEVRHECPQIESGLSTSRDWISDHLPVIPFDLYQGGNLRKSAEVENIYKCILIAGILKGSFLQQFQECCGNYNFDLLDSMKEDGINFSKLLTRWQDLQNLTVRIIVSGANLKISSEKNLEVGFLIGSLNKEETTGVTSIRDRVKSIIREYMLGPLSPSNVMLLTKIDRLSIIQEKDNKVLAEINSSTKFSELYKICALNADYLDPQTKNILSNYSSDFARKEASEVYKDDESGFKKFISICRRRAYKEAVIALKDKQLEIWRKEGNLKYKLPSKR